MLLACGVFEEEYDTINISEASQLVRLEGYELVELDVLNTELFNEVGEDTLMWSAGKQSKATVALTASLSIVFQPPDIVIYADV